jgi:hypothetical protein
MGIVVVKKPKLKSVDPVLRRAAEVTIANEKAAEEAKKKKEVEDITRQRRRGTSAPYGSI